ncbi:hypothetical protein ACIO6T_42315 [Streptomyces sp. NPDC087532]|uniref:hypothetical protein n=1 Tax=Streptomyces sp. NPDC087532 TaxID=3365795 RepID=UPI0037F991BA
MSSERFRTLFAVPEDLLLEDLFADAAAVAGVLTPGGLELLYRMAVVFGERGFGGPTGPHAPWLSPARLIQVLQWADIRAGGPIGSGRTLSHLRGLEPEAAVRHLTDLAGRFEQDEQFAQQGRTVWSEPGQRPDPSRVLDDLEAWAAGMVGLEIADYRNVREDVTPVRMMGYLRSISTEPVGLHVPGLGSDGVPLHQVGTRDLVDLADLVRVWEGLPEDEMQAAAEGAGLAPSLGPFLLRLADVLGLEVGQLHLLRVVRESLLNSLRGGESPQTWLEDVFPPYLEDHGIDVDALYEESESEVRFVRGLLERLRGLGLNIDELPGLGERVQSELVTAGVVEPGAYGDLTPDQGRVVWDSFVDGEAPVGEFVRSWRAEQLGMPLDRYDALVGQPWFDVYGLRELSASLGVGEDLRDLVGLAERLQAMPWGLVELVRTYTETPPQEIVRRALHGAEQVQHWLGSGVLRWPPVIGMEDEPFRRRNVHAQAAGEVGREMLTSGRDAAGRLAARLSERARENGEHWIGTEEQRLARTSGGADRFLNSGSGSGSGFASGSASGSASSSGSGSAAGAGSASHDAASTTSDLTAEVWHDAASTMSDVDTASTTSDVDAASTTGDVTGEVWVTAELRGMARDVARVFAEHPLPDGVDVDAVMKLAHDWLLDAGQAAMLVEHVQELGRLPEEVVGLTQGLGVGPNQVFELAGRLGVPPEHLVMVSGELSGVLDGVPSAEQVASGADVLRRRLAEAGFIPEDLGWFAGSGLQLRPQDLVGFRRFVQENGSALEELRSGAADDDGLVSRWLDERSRADEAESAAFEEQHVLRPHLGTLRHEPVWAEATDDVPQVPQTEEELAERLGVSPEDVTELIVLTSVGEDLSPLAFFDPAQLGDFVRHYGADGAQERASSHVQQHGLRSVRDISWFRELAARVEEAGPQGERFRRFVASVRDVGAPYPINPVDERETFSPIMTGWQQGLEPPYTLPSSVNVAGLIGQAYRWRLDAAQTAALVNHVAASGQFPHAVVDLVDAWQVGPAEVLGLSDRLGVLPEHLATVVGELPWLGDVPLEERVELGAFALRSRLAAVGFQPEDLGWFAGHDVRLGLGDLAAFRRHAEARPSSLEALRGLAEGDQQDRDALGAYVTEWLDQRPVPAEANRVLAGTLMAAPFTGSTLRLAADRLRVDLADLARLFPRDVALLHEWRTAANQLESTDWTVPERWVDLVQAQWRRLGLHRPADWAGFGRLVEQFPAASDAVWGAEPDGTPHEPRQVLGSLRYLRADQFLSAFGLSLGTLLHEPPARTELFREIFTTLGARPEVRTDTHALGALDRHLREEADALRNAVDHAGVRRILWDLLTPQHANRLVTAWLSTYEGTKAGTPDTEETAAAPYQPPPRYADLVSEVRTREGVQPPPYSGPGESAAPPLRGWAARAWNVPEDRLVRLSADEIWHLEMLRERLGIADPETPGEGVGLERMGDLLNLVALTGEESPVTAWESARALGLTDIEDLFRVLELVPVRLDVLHQLAGPQELVRIFRPLSVGDAPSWAVDQVAEQLRRLVESGDTQDSSAVHWSLRPSSLADEGAALRHFLMTFDVSDAEEARRLLGDAAWLLGARTSQDRAWLYRLVSDPAFAGPGSAASRAWNDRWLAPSQVFALLEWGDFHSEDRDLDSLRQLDFVDVLEAVDRAAEEYEHETDQAIQQMEPVTTGAEAVMDGIHDWISQRLGVDPEEYAVVTTSGTTLQQLAEFADEIWARDDAVLDLFALSIPTGQLPAEEIRAVARQLDVPPALGPFLLRLSGMLGLGSADYRLLGGWLRSSLLTALGEGLSPQSWQEEWLEPDLEAVGVDMNRVLRGERTAIESLRKTLTTFYDAGLSVHDFENLEVDFDYALQWRAGQMGVPVEQIKGLTGHAWFDMYRLLELASQLGMADAPAALVGLTERIQAVPWALGELARAYGLASHALVRGLLEDDFAGLRRLTSGVLRWPPVIGMDEEPERRRELAAEAERAVGRALLTAGRDAAERLAAQLSQEAWDSGEQWIGTEEQRLARQVGAGPSPAGQDVRLQESGAQAQAGASGSSGSSGEMSSSDGDASDGEVGAAQRPTDVVEE